MKRCLFVSLLMFSILAIGGSLKVAGSAPDTLYTPTDITITIESPSTDELFDDEMHVEAVVSSTSELTSVTATVENATISLTYDSFLTAFIGNLPLHDINSGELTVTVTATDVNSLSVSESVQFIKDEFPSIIFESPFPSGFVRSQFEFSVRCEDDDSAGCQQLTVSANGQDFTGTDILSGTFRIEDRSGESEIYASALDSRNQNTTRRITVYVDDSTRIEEVADFNGTISDTDGERVLYSSATENGVAIKIHDIPTETEVAVVFDAPSDLNTGILTNSGAALVVCGDDCALYSWKNGSLSELSTDIAASSLAVDGNYILWLEDQFGAGNDQQWLYLHDAESELTELVASYAGDRIGNVFNDVEDNGNVVYWSEAGIFLYDATTKITTPVALNDAAYANFYPIIDGDRIVYAKKELCCGGLRAIALFEDGNETILSEGMVASFNVLPNAHYAANDGWLAYLKQGLSQVRLWRMSPTGVVEQVSSFGIPSGNIDSVNSDGTILYSITYLTGTRLWWNTQEGDEIEIATDGSLWKSFWVDGQAYRTVGGSLLTINPWVPDLVLSGTASSAAIQSGETLTYTVSVTNSSPFAATDAVVYGVIDTNNQLVSTSIGECTLDGVLLTCPIGSLAPSEMVELGVVIIGRDFPQTMTTFLATSADDDYNADNAIVTLTTTIAAFEAYVPILQTEP